MTAFFRNDRRPRGPGAHRTPQAFTASQALCSPQAARAPRTMRVRSAARSNRRGVALLLAIFSMVVVGTTTVAYVSSRESSVAIARNAQAAADARTLAASGLELTKRILTDTASTWRTDHTRGRLLANYSLDGGQVTVDLVDIERRAAGQANVTPNGATTEVEATVTSSRNGSTWTTVAHLSIPSVANGQFAIFGQRYIGATGTRNVIGRWEQSPLAARKLRVNLGTGATQGREPSVSERIAGNGIKLAAGVVLEAEALGGDPGDDTSLSTWVYYPANASAGVLWGNSVSAVAARQMEPGKPTSLIAAPNPPSLTAGFTNYGNNLVLNNVTATYSPFRVKAALLPQLFTRNFEVRNNSVITLTAGTYEVWGSWILRDSRIIVQGDVRIVINPNLALTGVDWQNSSVELNANATLEIYNGYAADVTNCWVGARYICADEPDPVRRDGDPHKAAWWNRFSPTACHLSAPSSPAYIEPWRIRFYPIPQFLSNAFSWDFTDSSIVGSIFLPSNPVNLYGRTIIWGRVAANDVVFNGTASLYYDHMLDEMGGLTEGMSPARGGDPGQLYPMRVVRYGFDADSAR